MNEPILDSKRILGPDGSIARRLSQYEDRPQQLQMADAVASSLDDSHHLIVEAGTGVGKSFAYLVPSILYATADQEPQPDANTGPGGPRRSESATDPFPQLDHPETPTANPARRRRVIISTHTIALQEQLLSKDLPLLQAVIPREFSAVLAKGRGNYMSLRRMQLATERQGQLFQGSEETEQIGQIQHWATKTGDGSRSDLSFRPLPQVWDEVASDSGNCLGRKCGTYDDCFYYRARRRIHHAQIIVVNHALFFSDLALRRVNASILPDYDAVVFDEAHTLESVASSHLGISVTSGQVEYTLRKLYNDRTQKGLFVVHKFREGEELVEQCYLAADDFFQDVQTWLLTRAGENGRCREPHAMQDFLSAKLSRLAKLVRLFAADSKDEAQRTELNGIKSRLEQIAASVRSWVDQTETESVYWVESTPKRKGPPRIALKSCPIDVGNTLRDELFDVVPSVIMTSATLAVGKSASFQFFQSRIGLARAETSQVGSPFDYQSQTRLILVRGLSDPSQQREQFERQSAEMVKRYVERTDGNAFVLVTSYDMLRKLTSWLNAWAVSEDYRLISQSSGMPRSQMVEEFRNQDRTVLLGADSFWQGVDVPGDALRNVIIPKLPFSVPGHPVLEARLESIRASGGNPFFDYQLPEAIVKLKQGFGRLIRTASDQGIVVILDPRVHTKRYGRAFVESLPECELVEEWMRDTDQSLEFH